MCGSRQLGTSRVEARAEGQRRRGWRWARTSSDPWTEPACRVGALTAHNGQVARTRCGPGTPRVRLRGRHLSAIVLALSLAVAACSGDRPPVEGPDRNGAADSAPSANDSSTPAGFEADIAAIRSVMDTLVEGDVVPGLVVLARHRTDVQLLASGQAVVTPESAMSPRHVFRIGSITKPMVAVTVLKLVERGLVSLDDTVDRRLPGLVPNGNAITIEQLLSHSSGLADYLDSPRFPADLTQRPMSPRELVGLGTSQPVMFPPGRGAHYSNTGYILLGMIIERVTHRSLSSNLRSAVFAPVGMKASSLGTVGTATAPVARGYENGEDVSDLRLGWAWAAGAVVSDARDVSAFFTQLLSGRLVRRGLLTHMQDVGEPMPEAGIGGYGLGLAEVDTRCGTTWGHEGQLPGFASAAWLNEKTDRQVVVLANGSVDAIGLTFQKLINTALCGAD